MSQALLDLPTDVALLPADPVARTGFQIGWDHAHHGLAPPAELMPDGSSLGQGWLAGKAVFGRRTLAHGRATRQWLVLRTLAWRQGIAYDDDQLTPSYLTQIAARQCPVMRTPLGAAPGQPDAAVVDRLNPQAGYAAGNLALLSQRAVTARQGVDVPQALRHASQAQASGEAVGGLDAAAWRRLAVLRSFATPLPFHEAARLPLALLPPNRVRLLNAPQGLQALLTLHFATPGWSARTRSIAALLPAHTLRHDFNLFVGALAPRVLEAPQAPAALRLALEDAWLNERVQRRWQHLVMSLGASATDTLLQRATEQGLAGVRTLHRHAAAQATGAWPLAAGGTVEGRPLLPPPRPKPAPAWHLRRAAPAVHIPC